MKSMLAPLSPHEEAALRKVGFCSKDSLEPAHLRRLVGLQLVEWTGQFWQLTLLGRQRHASLVGDAGRPSAREIPQNTDFR
jgi:hypothetical protein